MENAQFRRYSYIFLLVLAAILAGCSGGVNENLRSAASGGETSNSDEESLFGSLDYPAEDTLTTYLTADIDNSQVRCEHKGDNAIDAEMYCYIVVNTFDGSEQRPTKIASGLNISWNGLKNTSGGQIGSCSAADDKLSANCTITDKGDETLEADQFVVTQVSLSKEGETKMTEDKTKLNFSIGAVAGLVPTIPVSYKSLVTDPGISYDLVPSSVYLNAGLISKVGYQSISKLLTEQKVINDRGIGFISSACIREKKIYFTAGINVFWIQDWTAENAMIQVYSGATSLDRTASNSSNPGHRMWVNYTGDQMVYCAPSGAVVADHSKGIVWRLWDSGKAEHLIGEPKTDPQSCFTENLDETGFLSKDNAAGAKDKKLSCLGGLEFHPTTKDIYFTHSKNEKDQTDIFKYSHSDKKISHILQLETEFMEGRIFDSGIFKGTQNLFRQRNKTRSPAFKLLPNGKFLVSDEYAIIEGDIFKKTQKILNRPVKEYDSSISADIIKSNYPHVRGFYFQDDDLHIGSSAGIQKYPATDSNKGYISKDYINSGLDPSSMRESTQNRFLEEDAQISKVHLHAPQSIEKNKHPDYDNVIIAEWDALRILEKDGTIRTLFERARLDEEENPLEQTSACSEDLPAKDVIMPFISDLSFDSNNNLFLATSGVASPRVDEYDKDERNKESASTNIDYYTYYDLLTLHTSPTEDPKLRSYKNCIDGTLYVDNTVVNNYGDNINSVSNSEENNNGIAIRQDWYSAFVGDDLYLVSGDRLYKKNDLSDSLSPVQLVEITPIAAHEGKLQGFMDKMENLSQLSEIDNYYVETPALSMTSFGNKLYILTGLVRTSTDLASIIQGGGDVGKLVTGQDSIAKIIGKLNRGYKVVEIDLTPASGPTSRILYHSFPEKKSVKGLPTFNGEGLPTLEELRKTDLWDDAFQMASGGIDVVDNAGTLDFFVTSAFLFTVENFSIDATTQPFNLSAVDAPGNPDPQVIAGKTVDGNSDVKKSFKHNVSATDEYLWNPWDLTVSDNGDIFVAEALGGGVKRIFKDENGNWKLSTIFGGDRSYSNCMAGEIEREVDGESVDASIQQSSSMLCKGDVWAVSAKDNCGSGDAVENMRIYMSQNFMTASNVIELIRPCD